MGAGHACGRGDTRGARDTRRRTIGEGGRCLKKCALRTVCRPLYSDLADLMLSGLSKKYVYLPIGCLTGFESAFRIVHNSQFFRHRPVPGASPPRLPARPGCRPAPGASTLRPLRPASDVRRVKLIPNGVGRAPVRYTMVVRLTRCAESAAHRGASVVRPRRLGAAGHAIEWGNHVRHKRNLPQGVRLP